MSSPTLQGAGVGQPGCQLAELSEFLHGGFRRFLLSYLISFLRSCLVLRQTALSR